MGTVQSARRDNHRGQEQSEGKQALAGNLAHSWKGGIVKVQHMPWCGGEERGEMGPDKMKYFPLWNSAREH